MELIIYFVPLHFVFLGDGIVIEISVTHISQPASLRTAPLADYVSVIEHLK